MEQSHLAKTSTPIAFVFVTFLLRRNLNEISVFCVKMTGVWMPELGPQIPTVRSTGLLFMKFN